MAWSGAGDCFRGGWTHLFSSRVASNLPRGEQPRAMTKLWTRIMMGLGLLASHAAISPAPAQNVVDRSPGDAVIEAAPLQAAFAQEVVQELPKPNVPTLTTVGARRTAAKLETHVIQLIEGWPWRPLHHVLGISGAETCFDHPDEMFYALSIALPHLSEKVRKAASEFLA